LIRLWERRLATSGRPFVRAGTATAVESVVATAEQVERLVCDADATGRWMRVPQPALRGETVAAAVRDGRLAAVVPLLGIPRTEVRARFTASEIREAASVLGTDRRTPRERPRARDKAEILRRLGEHDDLIGPIADA
jgi:hypothetical protein